MHHDLEAKPTLERVSSRYKFWEDRHSLLQNGILYQD